VRRNRGHGFDGGHQVGCRLIGQRHNGDIGQLGGLNDAAFNEPAEVDDERLAVTLLLHTGEGLARLQSQDAAATEGGRINVGGAGIEVVGDQDGA
jgi:hypothetical protein